MPALANIDSMTGQQIHAHQQFASERLILMSAPNGARRMPGDPASLPVTPIQIAACAKSLLQESVAVLHLHVRDSEHRHSLHPERYREATAAVRAAVGDAMIVQITTEAAGRFQRDEQMAIVRALRPEAVSLALREFCPDDSSEIVAARFFEWLVRERIWPQYILYSAEDVIRFDRLRRKGFFADEHPFCLFVLGQYASGHEGKVGDLVDLIGATDCDEFPWSVCCFGKHENPAALHAVAAGGHVRLGFENNVLLQDGSVAPDNAALIAQFNASRDDQTRRPALADEVRELWLAKSP